MPQDTLTYAVTDGDTVYIINSPDDLTAKEIKKLPPEIQESIRKSFSEKKEVEGSQNDYSFFAVGLFVFLIAASLIQIIKVWSGKPVSFSDNEFEGVNNQPATGCLQYAGRDLIFSNTEINRICLKYNSYYCNLSGEKKDTFIARLKKFLQTKTFYICSNQGYKEMPVLVSAAAIQITFGLDDFLLPYFENIVIHPQEYFGTNPLRILEGNVQGTSINLSWKHFLEDYQNPADGKNVGLHEMAHALQVQYLFNTGRDTNEFKEDFAYFDKVDDEIIKTEKNRLGSLFDSNALSNVNEFWATSVELFFEKPLDLKARHPELYKSICIVLNQGTATE